MMWKNFLIAKLKDNRSKVEELLELDESITFDSLMNIINKDMSLNINNYDTYLLENSFIILINLIEKLYNKKRKIILCSMDNYSLNSFIVDSYYDYIKEYGINDYLEIEINEHFNISDKNIVSIGSEAFNKEMKSIYKNIECFNFDI